MTQKRLQTCCKLATCVSNNKNDFVEHYQFLLEIDMMMYIQLQTWLAQDHVFLNNFSKFKNLLLYIFRNILSKLQRISEIFNIRS